MSCLLTQQMSCLLTQQMSCPLTQQMSCLQTQQMSFLQTQEIPKFLEVAGSQVALSPSNRSKSENAASSWNQNLGIGPEPRVGTPSTRARGQDDGN